MNLVKSLKKMWFVSAITAMLSLLSASCGGVGSAESETFFVGGEISGLNGTLVIQNNGQDQRSASSNGTFTFYSSLADGAAYGITVSTQPLRQICTVTNGSGTIRSADVTNVLIACSDNAGGVTLSGRIAVPPDVVTDSSVNDINEEYESNETFETAQILPNPITVGGYVNQTDNGPIGRFNTGSWSYVQGNMDDYYQVQLKKGDVITLAIGEPNPYDNDLDLYLYDYYTPDIDSPVSYSAGTGTYEFVEAPTDGTYFVNVYASSGASNYILTIGADSAAAAIAAADPNILSSQREMVPGQVIVRFKDTVKAADSANPTLTQYTENMGLTQLAGSPGREMLFSVDEIKFQAYAQKIEVATAKTSGNQYAARMPNTFSAIKQLRKQSGILSAEPNYIVRTDAIPNDEHYPIQWHYPMIQLPEAWDITKGDNNVIVAVLDTGVLIDHPDLKDRLTAGYSFVSGETGSNVNDPGGNRIPGVVSTFHGTHVAGTIAAQSNNTSGISGVTWGTKIMPVRVMDGNGSGSTFDIMQGIRYAAGLLDNSPAKKADIINMSLGGPSYLQSFQDVVSEARAKGVIIVAAAGNENTSVPSYPASYEGVISVSAVNINGGKASYSNYGLHIDVAAPGGDSGDFNGDGYPDMILSAGGDDSADSVVYNYSFKAGTSMAAPHVAGTAALMKAAYPALSPGDIDALLEGGNITDYIGRADYYGYGLINAFKAVSEAKKLAGGGEITGADANPRIVNFGSLNSETTVNVSKIGSGALSITGCRSDAGWLKVEPGSSVGDDGFGSYIISVDRSDSGLREEGTYAAVVTFTTSEGKTVSVRVTVQVRSTAVTYDAGTHYALLFRIKDDDTIEQADYFNNIKSSGGYYSYFFHNVPPGRYMIVAGSDRNNNSYLGDGGEALGAYPVADQIVDIDVGEEDISGLDFTTNLRLSIVNNGSSIVESDSPPAADQSLYKRPGLPGESTDVFRYTAPYE